ncbi:MAG: V-type ATP synthase subunit I [Deltaproteobacteria bacterium]|nr:V-type ATP synthase subunit I [Deltaproteobacteria bacterium]
MKKIYVVVLDSFREQALLKLRDMGLVHVDLERDRSSEALNSLIAKKALFERALLTLSQIKNKPGTAQSTPYRFSEAEKTARRIAAIQEDLKRLEDEREKIRRDLSIFAPWGDFDPALVEELGEKGVPLRFFQLSNKQFNALPENIAYLTIYATKDATFIIVADFDGTASQCVPTEPFIFPKRSMSGLATDLEKNNVYADNLKNELASLTSQTPLLTHGLDELTAILEFESVNTSMGTEDRFAYLSGYIPVDKLEYIRKEAAKMNWALLVRDPQDHEMPPTLIKNPKWVEVIQPLFRFLDTTPGYREFDVSLIFLCFLSLFTAMIIGDAGYGMIFLGLTLFMRMKLKQAPPQAFILLAVLSISTMVWGVITGTWFGSKTLGEIPLLKALVIPEIASLGPKDTTAMIEQLCFVIGMTQLTIGLLISFVRKMPSLAAIAELGWFLILCCMYFVARYFVLGVPLHSATIPLFAAGFTLVLFFSEQKGGNIAKGVLYGILWSPMKFLNSVSMFADLVSYIRLFAVGLATVAVAQSFNVIASRFEGLGGAIAAALILLLAHTFNMAMALLAVIVHGVRLNMLEFGGKVGMEWSGYAYNPFRKKGL